MPEQSITIKFKAAGDQKLIRQLQMLDIAVKNLTGKTSVYTNQLKKQDKATALAVRNTRNLGNATNATGGAFSVLRSKMLLASFAAGLFAKTIGKMTKLYGEQELAEKRLENAIGRVSTALLAQASAFQKVTSFGDEEILNAMALAGAYTDNEKAIKKLSEAALDLSTAKGMDLNTTMDLLTKSVFSSTNAMNRHGIEISGVAATTARLESATSAIANIYGGRAKKDTETFLGATKQLGNAIGDVGENIGSAFIPILLFSTKHIKSFAEALDEEKVKAYGTALLAVTGAYGLYTLWSNRAALSTLKLGKAMKLTGAGLVVAGLGFAIDKLNIYGTEAEDLEKELKKLEGTIGDLNFKQKISLDQQAQLALLTQKLNNIEEGRNEIESEELMLLVERQNLVAKKNKDLIEGNELKLAEINLNIKDAELSKKITNQKIADAKRIAKATGEIGNVMVSMGKGNKELTILGLQLSLASGVADSIAGAAKSFKEGGVPGFFAGMALMATMLSNVQTINAQIRSVRAMEVPKFSTGGLIGGKSHAQGGTMIEAESGEFVMSRSAVESVGIENMNRINQGGGAVTVNVSGNVLTQDFVEGELAEAIREASRKGTEFGVS